MCVAPHVLGGADVASVIISAAARYGCGLIVIGTHGRRGVTRLFAGSTAEAVIRNAAEPVLALHDRRASTELRGGPRTADEPQTHA